MPSKVKPTAVRLCEARLAKVDANARERGISRHAMLLRMVDAYEGAAPSSPRQVLAEAEARAAHLSRRAKWGA